MGVVGLVWGCAWLELEESKGLSLHITSSGNFSGGSESTRIVFSMKAPINIPTVTTLLLNHRKPVSNPRLETQLLLAFNLPLPFLHDVFASNFLRAALFYLFVVPRRVYLEARVTESQGQ